jgi:O-antigen/teichoic acid export membrane protein
VLGATFLVIFPMIQWAPLLRAESPLAGAEAGPALRAYAACFCVGIPLSIIARIRAGYQEGFSNSIWDACGCLAGLSAVAMAIHQRLDLPWLVLALAGFPVFFNAINGIVLFGRDRVWLRPCWNLVRRESAKQILRIGWLFFMLQLAVTLMLTSDNIVADAICGPSQVAEYSISARLFSIVPLFLGMALTPLWPAYGEANARGDQTWIKRTFLKSFAWSLALGTLGSLLLILVGAPLVRMLSGGQVTPSLPLLYGMALWTVMLSGGAAVAVLYNGLNVIGFQIVIAGLTATAAIVLKIVLTSRYGISGLAWATAPAYFVFTIIPSIFFVPALLKTSRGQNA